MPPTGIDTVAGAVANRAVALRWYCDVLGMKIALIGPEDPAREGSPGNRGHWIEWGDCLPMTRIRPCELSNRRFEPGPTSNTFLSDSIERDHASLAARGVRFLTLPRHMDRGEGLCAFCDPDGNEFDLKQAENGATVVGSTQTHSTEIDERVPVIDRGLSS
jgi:catechol 2,3-dioxygenase-like lactoylglutathione lyase family enzyme